MPLVRASSLDRFWDCSGWLIGVEHFTGDGFVSDSGKKAAEWGTMVHTWKETGKVLHPQSDKGEEKLFQKRLDKTGIRREDYWPQGGVHEIHFAWNWKTRDIKSEFGPNGEEWKAGFGTDWITGTTDWLYTDEDGWWIDDLKTGKWWNKRPEQSKQVVFYGMCAWKLRPEIDQGKLSVTHWPRYPVAKKPNRQKCYITSDQFEWFEEQLVKRCETVPIFKGTEEGCRFCPKRNNCDYVWKESV